MTEPADQDRPEEYDPITAALDGAPTEMADPVVQSLGTDRDLYDIATWEVRTTVDELAVRVATGIRTHRRTLLYGGLGAILFSQSLTLLVSLMGTKQPKLVLGGLLLLSFLPGVLITWYLWYQYVKPPKPLKPVLFTFGIAFVLASAASILSFQFEILATLPAVGSLLFTVGILVPINELTKWVAVRSYTYRTPDFSHVVDGALYGAAAGLGFTLATNMLLLTFYLSSGATPGAGPAGDVWSYATLLMIDSPGQVLSAGIAGYYLGLAKFNPTNSWPIAVKGVLLAVGLQAIYTVVLAGILLIGFWPGVLFTVAYFSGLYVFLVRKVRRYRRVQQTAIAAPTTDESEAVTQLDTETKQSHAETDLSDVNTDRPTVDDEIEAAGNHSAIIEQLTALQELHRLDFLSDGEFDEKRPELLDRI